VIEKSFQKFKKKIVKERTQYRVRQRKKVRRKKLAHGFLTETWGSGRY